VQQHQREQPRKLDGVRQELPQQTAEPDRLVAEIGVDQRLASLLPPRPLPS